MHHRKFEFRFALPHLITDHTFVCGLLNQHCEYKGDKLQQVVVVLQSPELKGDTLVYSVKILQGDMPVKGADVSIFIDIIGMPLTPLSYAGVARRTYRRAVWR